MSDSVTNVDNSSELANNLFTALTNGMSIPSSPDLSAEKFNITPDNDSELYSLNPGANIEDVTTNALEGTGVFDVFMSVMNKHLDKQYQENRITGSQYAEAYVQISTQTLGQATQFVLQKEQAKWTAILAQMQARLGSVQATQALVELEKMKIEVDTASFQSNLVAAQNALTKMQIASEEARHNDITTSNALKEHELCVLRPVELAQQEHILHKRQPAETELVLEQVEVQRANTLDTRRDGLTSIGGVIALQKRNLTTEVGIKDFTLANQLPKQVELVEKQIILTQEQSESERAKTLDVRSDGESVEGSVGKQKDLYSQQIDSFIKDAQYKVAKMSLDGWITQKTLDEGLSAPDQLTNAEVDNVLSKVRTNNNL